MHKLVIIDDSECKESLEQFLYDNQKSILLIISEEEFNQRMEHIISNLSNIYKMHRKIVCRNYEGISRIPVSEIIYIREVEEKCLVHNEKGRNEVIEESLERLEKELKELGFFRLNTDILINMDFMERYIPGEDSCVILTDSSQIPIDKERENDFFKYLSKWK